MLLISRMNFGFCSYCCCCMLLLTFLVEVVMLVGFYTCEFNHMTQPCFEA